MPDTIVEMRKIVKSFSGIEVLHGVDFSLRRGEILGLVGENGAGKSTLMGILIGSHPKDSGDVYIEGELQKDFNIKNSLDKEITMIPQELALVPAITVGENILLGQRNTNKLGMVDWNVLQRTADNYIREMGFKIDPYVRLDNLPIAYRQLVAIIKAVAETKKVIIMDEPTSSLSRDEVIHLHKVIKNLKQRGTTIVYISHLLEEIFNIADRITILRDGHVIGTKWTSETSEREIVSMMVGDQLFSVQDELLHRQIDEPVKEKSKIVLEVKKLRRSKHSGFIDFELREGEILGITGLVGAGKTELARNIFALDKYIEGQILINGRPVRMKNPIDAIRYKIMLVSEDRKLEGLVLSGNVQENITMAGIYRKRISILGFRNFKQERKDSVEYIKRLSIKIANLEQRILNLSGGNQQKVVLSKALVTKPAILILDEPTRGIDVGAKAMIYRLIRELRNDGISILFLSSDVNEMPLVCDRLLVLRAGKIVKELAGHDIITKNIINYVAGVE
ncbi:MAG: sugar ABC transporter ATP-binding protein [Treponema sp.]|jgi:ABC-type sugar transport system ATPase subunit|nr:sugar ABC transporter ATP-binding protein [Treponema sp.]